MRNFVFVLVPMIGLLGAQIGMMPPPAQRNPFEAVPEVREAPRVKGSGPSIEAIEFRGAKRIPQSLLAVLTLSRAGDGYDAEAVRRDAQALYDTGRFSRIVWEIVPEREGVVVRFHVFERPLIRSIVYRGDETVSVAEILERFRERKVRLLLESFYIEDELDRAATAVQEFLAERGRPNTAVTASVKPIAPEGSVDVAFQVAEKR